MSVYLITADDARLALGDETYLALFDDSGTRQVSEAGVQAVIARASTHAMAYLPNNYPTVAASMPSPVPEMVKELTLAYFSAFAYPRNVDYMKVLGMKASDLLAAADRVGDQVRLAVKRLFDVNVPPTNVGGKVGGIGNPPVFPTPFFEDLGDFSF